jgi:hypothetical protein
LDSGWILIEVSEYGIETLVVGSCVIPFLGKAFRKLLSFNLKLQVGSLG